MTTPQNIKVILVGIETYKGGAVDLDGPANDVYKVAQWLINQQKVPTSDIDVFLSYQQTNTHIAEHIKSLLNNNNLKEPTHSEFYKTLKSFLEQNLQNYLLFVYWSGHGLIWKFDKQYERLLVCAGTTKSVWETHNFNNLVSAMQTELWSKKFTKQYWIIDTCANQPKQDIGNNITNTDYWNSKFFGAPQQMILYASSKGEKAKIHPEKKTSWYTLELFDYLENSSTNDIWNLDFNAAAQHLSDKFKKLKEQGKVEQHPCLVRLNNPCSSINIENYNDYPNLLAHNISSYREDLIKDYMQSQDTPSDPNNHLLKIVWDWFLPQQNSLSLESLYQKNKVNEDIQSFVSQIEKACNEIKKEHPQLSLWIRRKMATLDYEQATPDVLDSYLSTLATQLNWISLDIMRWDTISRSAPNESIRKEAEAYVKKRAKKVVEQALQGASQAIIQNISPNPNKIGFWSNLMLPLTSNDIASFPFSSTKAKSNHETAQKLWNDVQKVTGYLMVAFEFPKRINDDEHIGFWIPICSSYPQTYTSGATEAYYNLKEPGSAIFLDDLPPIGKDLANTNLEEWENYMKQYLQGQLGFVSIPFFINTDNNIRKVLAILNVHFCLSKSDQDGDNFKIFRRAYEKKWLRIAGRQSASLIFEAYKAIMILHASRNQEILPDLESCLEYFPLATQ